MIFVLSKFRVANGLTSEVKSAFADRPHRVEAAPGFIRLDVVSPCDSPDEIWLLTYWRDLGSYTHWHSSPEHHASHKGIPKGLKLVASETQVRVFDHVCS